MPGHHHKSVYLSAPLRKALKAHPDINIGQVCKVALEAATGLIQTNEATSLGELPVTISSKLSEVEAQTRANTLALEKIAKLAAVQAGMTILTKEESQIYHEIISNGVRQFVLRTKKEAVEEYKQSQMQAKRRRHKNKPQNQTEPTAQPQQHTTITKPEHESSPPAPRSCTACGDIADVTCLLCGAPLCWTCWTGPDLEAIARETCPTCWERLQRPSQAPARTPPP